MRILHVTPYRYRVIARRTLIEDAGIQQMYGIVIERADGRPLACVENISGDNGAVEALCRKIAAGHAHPAHLRDIVLDWLHGAD